MYEKDNTTDLIDHLQYYGIEYHAETQTVKFEKKFDIAKSQVKKIKWILMRAFEIIIF